MPILLRRMALYLLPLLAVICLSLGQAAFAQSGVDPNVAQPAPQASPEGGQVPGGVRGTTSDADMWRAVRQGTFGTVSIPDRKAGQLIQSEGENWRVVRNGAVSYYGIWGLLGMIGLLALFFLVRGRIMIEAGKDGRTITRFDFTERMAHWLLGVSFILLALTGLNILYGRYVIMPVVGPEIFGAVTNFGKHVHNYISFAFMVGLLMVFVMWVGRNIPGRTDLKWLMKAGGLFSKGGHASSHKFNAGQKILYWLVLLLGLSVSLSGIALLFPFEFPLFAKTFAFLNVFGFDLPTTLSVVQEMQLAQIWHAIIGLVMIGIILGHIYIGTIGMQGAFAAMGSGQVDLNWAREHHDLWVEEKLSRRGDDAVHGGPAPKAHPAE
ncbi:formate dehydrogenase subunit gamma [Lutibaculum baratangense]|uniref:Formate dehydrogenase-O, gamma subunit n=1 Tax=Lutibaculum baratangense AMV1 TaxID=631454 RepID=V4R9J0_9HYPH|nr:formate dehydrogenase subunit gamma [Lutibaculum baratangense]ESR22866.1 Formate dehydrogenase -O, gamma subunit [Lutibaculum baratangense AMV1]